MKYISLFKICQNCDPTATNTLPFWCHFYTVTNDVTVSLFYVFKNSYYEIWFSRPILLQENYPSKNKHPTRPNYIFPRTSLSVKEKLMIKSSGTKGNCQCSTHLIKFFIWKPIQDKTQYVLQLSFNFLSSYMRLTMAFYIVNWVCLP